MTHVTQTKYIRVYNFLRISFFQRHLKAPLFGAGVLAWSLTLFVCYIMVPTITLRRSERLRNNRSRVFPLSETSGVDEVTGTSSLTEDLMHDATTDEEPKLDTSKLPSQEVQVARPDKYVRGRRGHLKLMAEIPLDTLHEIFGELDPIDLLHLSWASKSLHTIIMEQSARYIWEQVSLI